MQFLVFLQSILFFIIFFFTTFLWGHLFLKINEKFCKNIDIVSVDFIKPVLGFSTLVLFSYYLYFNLNLYLQDIIIFFVFFSFVILIFCKNENVLLSFYKILKSSIPIFLVFMLYATINGEQFYIFRGNYWDSMNYISTSILVKEFSFSEILELRNNNLEYENALLHNGTKNIFVRPISTIILAIFLFFKIDGIFYTNYLFKVFLIIQIFCSFYFLISQFKISEKYFISIIFVFSFWILYVFEIDAQSQLGSISFFLCLIGILINQNIKTIFSNKYYVNIFLLLCCAFFIFYPEFYLIFTLFFLIFVFLHKDFLSIINKEKFNFLYLLGLFLLFTLPSYSTNYVTLFLQSKVALNPKIDYWGYYGLFILGDTIDLISRENIFIIKELFQNNNQIINLIPILKNFFIENKYYLIPLNIIPSLTGLYYITIGKVENLFSYLYLFITIFLNVYIIFIFKENIIKIFSKSKKINLIFLTSFFLFCLLSPILIINGNYWIVIKLYFFISPLIYLFLSIKLINDKNKKLKLNLFFLILVGIFPIYKFSVFNDGIGRLDNFPSIINPIYKKEISWNFTKKDLLECENLIFYSSDKIIDGYIAIKLYDFGFRYHDKKLYKIDKNRLQDGKKKLCEVKLIDTKFKIKNYGKN